MKTILAFVICGVLCSVGALSQNKTTISGTLSGANGQAMKVAHVHAMQFNSVKDKPQSYDVKADASFSFSLPNGWYILEFTGVDHKQERTPNYVYCSGNDVRLKVMLEANAVEEKIDSVGIVTDLDKYSFSKVRMMSANNDGTWSADISTRNDTLGYQVIVYTKGMEGPHSVNGTQSDRYTYDGGGDYRSVVAVKNGTVHVSYDPRAAAYPKVSSSCEFLDEYSKNVDKILKEQRDLMSRWFKEYTKKQDGKEFSWDAAKIRSGIYEGITSEKDVQLRPLRMMTYLGVRGLNPDSDVVDANVVDEILRTIPPSSEIWGNYAGEVLDAIKKSSNPNSDYAEKMLRENPCSGAKAEILFEQIELMNKEKKTAEAQTLYDQLVKEYPDTYQAQRAIKELNPGRKVKVGAMIPNFAFEAIEDSTKNITPETVHGRWVLIDNWATWCGPCVGEMGSLHKAYEAFKDKNFTILSVSFDRGKTEIAKFRNGKWPMPWLHCFSPGVWQNEATKIFEVTGIPKPILIDPHGTIVAMGPELRGAALEQTLAKFVK